MALQLCLCAWAAVTAVSLPPATADIRTCEEQSAILQIEPSSGNSTAQTVVDIRGTGFPADAQVFFGEQEAEVLLTEVEGFYDRILAMAPPNVRLARVDVRVVDRNNPDLFCTSPALQGGGFEYVPYLVVPPVLMGVVSSGSSGKSVVGARVGAAPGGHKAVADLTGVYTIPLFSTGTYTVRAYASGFRGAVRSVNVGEGDVLVTVNLRLQPYEPVAGDLDGDSLSDDDEKNLYGTNPALPDTDTDGVADGTEVYAGLDPLDFTDGALFLRADVDANERVDARDVQLVVNGLLGYATRVPYDTDLDGSGEIDALDLQWVVNIATASFSRE